MDLFVLDRLPDSKVGAWNAKFLQKVIYGMAIAHRDQIDFSKYSLMDKAAGWCAGRCGAPCPDAGFI